MHTVTHTHPYTQTNKNCQLEVLPQSPIIAQCLADRYLKDGTWRREHSSEESRSATALSTPYPGLCLLCRPPLFHKEIQRPHSGIRGPVPNNSLMYLPVCPGLQPNHALPVLRTFWSLSDLLATTLNFTWLTLSPLFFFFFCLTRICPALWSSSRVLSVQTQEVLAQLQLSEHITQCAIVLWKIAYWTHGLKYMLQISPQYAPEKRSLLCSLPDVMLYKLEDTGFPHSGNLPFLL